VDVVVEVGGAELDVGVPAVPDELGADDLAGSVRMREGSVQHEGGAGNRADGSSLEGPVLIHADADEGTGLEALRAGECEAVGALRGGGDDALTLDGIGADSLLVVEAGVDAVACLDVELHEVDVQVGLGEAAVEGIVLELAAEQHVDAVLRRIGPDRQWSPQGVTSRGEDGILLAAQYVDLPLRVHQVAPAI